MRSAITYTASEINLINTLFGEFVRLLRDTGTTEILFAALQEDSHLYPLNTPSHLAKARIVHAVRWGYMGGHNNISLDRLLRELTGGCLRATLLGAHLRLCGHIGLDVMLAPISAALSVATGRGQTPVSLVKVN